MYVRCRSDQTHVKRCKHSHSARLHVKVNGEDDRMTTAVKRSLNEALEERQWRRVRAKGHMSPQSPGASKEGAPKEGCGNFLQHEIYQNSVSSVEAEMGMERQIMCIEQCTF